MTTASLSSKLPGYPTSRHEVESSEGSPGATSSSETEAGLNIDGTGGAIAKLAVKDATDDASGLTDSDVDPTDEENDGTELTQQQVAASAAPALKKFLTALNDPPDELKGNPQVIKAVDTIQKICQREAERASVKRSKPESMSSVQKRLEKQREVIDRLQLAESRQAKLSSTTDNSESKLIKQVIGTFNTVRETLHLHCGAPSGENRQKIAGAIKAIHKDLDDLGKMATSGRFVEANKAIWKETWDELKLQLECLKEIEDEFTYFDSANSARKQLDERMTYVKAAIKVFESLIADVPDKKKSPAKAAYDRDVRQIKGHLEARLKTMEKSDPETLVNTGYPSDMLAELKKGNAVYLGKVALDEDVSESKLMAAVVDQFLLTHPGADSRSGKHLVAGMKGKVLDYDSDWAVIESGVMVPVEADTAPWKAWSDDQIHETTLVKVTTTTTPVGHVLARQGVTAIHRSGAVRNADLQDYINPNDKSVIHGRHSHATTEVVHGVNVARTEMSDGSRKLFSGTRHATLSPYDLFPDVLIKKPDTILGKIFDDLAREVKRATLVCTHDQGGNVDKALQTDATLNKTDFDREWDEATGHLTKEQFIAKARHDEAFCALLRRKAALNRAREVFLSEAIGNPEILRRIQQGDPVVFTSISLITPDPLRHFLAKLLPSKFRIHDELNMRREEVQAWKDLQASLNAGQLVIDNQKVNATILSFSAGVNQMSLSNEWGPLGRWLVSGWDQAADDNRNSLQEMIGDLDDLDGAGGKVATYLLEIEQQISEKKRNLTAQNTGPAAARILDGEVNALENKREELQELAQQLKHMWNNGSYRHAGAQPYKFAARLARLSYLMSGGTTFNCKSGKDRTAQLDLEVKLLTLQCEQRRLGARTVTVREPGKDTNTTPSVRKRPIVPPYGTRSNFEKRQLQAFLFQDRSRTVMQRYNTGVEGSKLHWWREFYDSFIAGGDEADYIGEEFRGRSDGVPS